MNDRSSRLPLRVWLVEMFVCANLAFLTVDIYLAHSYNSFAHWAEWIPFYFSLVSPVFLLPGIVKRTHAGFAYWSGLGVGGLSLAIGLIGLFLHLEGTFFEQQTLKALVYTAPFAAPLSYAGVGLLLILNRLESSESGWGAWVVFLALCGFVGNLALSLCDHAQNGFFVESEWIPVIAAAFAASFLVVVLFRPDDAGYLWRCQLTMSLQILVGLWGFYLHLDANLAVADESLAARFIYGAPIFAPLLFANLALLAMIGLWDMSENTGPAQ